MLDQMFIGVLAVIALDVAVGLAKKKNMWSHIVAYWFVLTAKNFISWLGGFV